MAQHKDVAVRLNFIHNLPAMLQILDSTDQLRQSYLKLCKDHSREIKIKCVSCFLEVDFHSFGT